MLRSPGITQYVYPNISLKDIVKNLSKKEY